VGYLVKNKYNMKERIGGGFMSEKCNVENCEYNVDGNCYNCDDVHNPNKEDECISFIDKNE
jgi:hypothetical protein